MRPQVVLHNSKTGALLTDVRALRGIIDAVPHPIFVKDSRYRFLIVNRAFCGMMGKSFDELIGEDDYTFFPQDQADVFRARDTDVMESGNGNENEEFFTDGEGIRRTILTGKSRLVLSDGTQLLVGCITDISDFRRAEATIRSMADHDYLTGLPNRGAFSGNMSTALAAAVDKSAIYSVLVIDLDGFKPINDKYGHGVGDLVLCEIARRLEKVVRGTDIVARFGGDEFAVISLINEPSRASAEVLATRILATLRPPIAIPGGQVSVGASIGIALCPTNGSDAEALLKAADFAMYKAKREGRQTFRFYDPNEDAKA
ncbi:hypothetical protein BH10PSE7_BH10PSE7_25710 [soil metagenome]